MLDGFPTDSGGAPPPDISLPAPVLPAWLARRLCRQGEVITWVRGPRLNPWWERYVTHPALFLPALALAAACLGAGRLTSGMWFEPLPALAAGGVALAAVFTLAISSTYFTRLVVTSARLVILQGYEVCRSWRLNELPPSLVRYDMRGGGRRSPSVDLNALQTLLGGPSARSTESKTILALGKHLDRIKARENGRP
jgi:hypothetical protein